MQPLQQTSFGMANGPATPQQQHVPNLTGFGYYNQYPQGNGNGDNGMQRLAQPLGSEDVATMIPQALYQ